MNLRTTFTIEPSQAKISYSTPVMFVGSCFASEIGSMMAQGKMNVAVNPSGTVFNPVSVMNTLDMVLTKKSYKKKDLFNYNGTYLSFLHYTNFNSDNPDDVLEKINGSIRLANAFLKSAGFLFITFGTARIYRYKETGVIVSNCHKIPDSFFTRELLTIDQITGDWLHLLDRMRSFNRKLKVIFTISPVRHWKDGAHANQVSKSTLFLSVEKLLGHPTAAGYFPSYELIMDDLRDYRFYDSDMLHPSQTALEYVWKAFTDSFFERDTSELWKKVSSISMAVNHRFISGSERARKDFARGMLKQIEALSGKNHFIDFSSEIAYFKGIINNR